MTELSTPPDIATATVGFGTHNPPSLYLFLSVFVARPHAFNSPYRYRSIDTRVDFLPDHIHIMYIIIVAIFIGMSTKYHMV